jgi:hypothetical protein
MLFVKAQAALDKAQRQHEERTESLEADCAMIERRIETEKTVEQKVMTLEKPKERKGRQSLPASRYLGAQL